MQIAEQIDRLYASVGDGEALRQSLAGVGGMIKAEAAGVHEYDFGRRQGKATPLLRFGEREIRGYLEHYSATNVWMLHGRPKVVPGRILLSHEMFPDDRLEDTEWYSDFLRPENLFYSSGVVLGVDEGVSTSASFLRSRASGRFTTQEAGLLRRLAPHLRRVFALHRRYLAASIQADDARNVLDCMPVGVIVVDGKMRIDSVNQRGRDIMAQGDGLRTRGDCLSGPPSHDRALRALVSAALATPPKHPEVLKIQQRGHEKPLEVSVSPIPAAPSTWGVGTPRAAVFVLDPYATEPLSPEVLAALHHLTPAEARLAALLVAGEELITASERLGVSMNTVRTQLRSIFGKTDASRQSELVHRLLTSPARFQRPAR